MFSSDENIETIGQLVEVVRHYIGVQQEYVRLDVVEKVVKLLTVITLTGVIVMLTVLALIYLSFAAVFSLAGVMSMPAAFCVVAAFYIVALLLFAVFRKRWIERPLVRFLASVLLEK